MRTTIRQKRVRQSKGVALFAMLLAAGAAHAQSEIIVDNGSPGFSTLGSWPTSTAVGGYYGTNYQTHAANGVPPGAIAVDNSDPGFAVTGTWPTSTAVAGYYGANYQVHAGNGVPPTAIAADNTQGSAAGTWPTSTSVGGYYGTNYQTHAAGTGTDSFTWTLNVATAGSYEVYARWTASPNRASNAKYTVAHSGGSDVVTANQQQNGASWQLLGIYAFDAGSATVSLSDEANGYVIADAVMLQPPGAAPNTATWTLPVPSAGTYNLYARWTAHPNRASDAKFTIDSASGSSTVTVNQQAGASGQWKLLGTYGFNAGAASVSLSDQANGYVIADAVMLAPPGAPPNSATWTLNLPAAGSYEVYAWWTANPNRASNATYTVAYLGGTAAVTVNQQTNGGAWNLLGAFDFPSGTGGSVSLTDQANGYVIADAIRLVPVQGQAQPAIYYIVPDHLDTPRMIANQQGTTVWKWDQQEPFGATPPNEDPDGDGVGFDFPLRLPGQYFDKETNLHYNTGRDYDPSVGRYVESDPMGLKAGLNTYVYVASNPLSYIDPDGLEVRLICRPVAFPGVGQIYDHCFVHVTCPAQGIDKTLSLFGTFPYIGSTGHKKEATPETYRRQPGYPDNPNIKNKYDQEIAPCGNNCCSYEKDVIARFNAAPSSLPYEGTIFNSNNFARYLITSPKFCAGVPSDAPTSAPGLH